VVYVGKGRKGSSAPGSEKLTLFAKKDAAGREIETLSKKEEKEMTRQWTRSLVVLPGGGLKSLVFYLDNRRGNF